MKTVRKPKPQPRRTAPQADTVNHPPHYTVGGIETIDFMQAKSTPEEFAGHLRLTTLKYLSRGPFKEDAIEDYKKARWYINRLINFLEGE